MYNSSRVLFVFSKSRYLNTFVLCPFLLLLKLLPKSPYIFYDRLIYKDKDQIIYLVF